MHIVICLDLSSFTEKYLTSIKTLLQSFKDCEISVIHIIDETLFTAGTGYEIQLSENLKTDSEYLKDLAVQHLGAQINYIEDYGIPGQKIDEILQESNYDMLVIGRHSRNILGVRLLGGVAEHLLHRSKKPVLVIP